MQWISTGQTTFPKAKKVCDAAKVEELQSAACANLLTHDVISRLLAGRRLSMVDIIDRWREQHCFHLAPDTLHNYESMLLQFVNFSGVGKEPLSSIRPVRLSAWVNAPNVPLGTRRLRLTVLKSFYGYCIGMGFSVGNPAKLVVIKTRDLLLDEKLPGRTKLITKDEYDTLMASPRVSMFWRSAIALSYWLGLRLRDIACLEWASIKDQKLVIFQQKTGGMIEFDLSDPMLGGDVLSGIFLTMMETQDPSSPYCFPVERLIALDEIKRAKLSVYFQRVLARHKIYGKRFHSLRHSCANRLFEAGRNLEDIAKVLGHSSQSKTVTQLYADHSPLE